MEISVNGGPYLVRRRGAPVEPLPITGEVVITVDPGKTNMAVCIGSPRGEIYSLLQFSGAGRAEDCSDYCQNFKDFLVKYLANVSILYFGMEEAITKKGMSYHVSSMTLTEIRAALIDVGYQLINAKPDQINNWSWKRAILPDGYRSQSEKGSVTYLFDFYKMYRSADATDAIAMYMYALQEKIPYVSPKVQHSDIKPIGEFSYVMTASSEESKEHIFYEYNQELSMEENLQYMAARTLSRSYFTAYLPALKDIPKNVVPMQPMSDFVDVWVIRCG